MAATDMTTASKPRLRWKKPKPLTGLMRVGARYRPRELWYGAKHVASVGAKEVGFYFYITGRTALGFDGPMNTLTHPVGGRSTWPTEGEAEDACRAWVEPRLLREVTP